MKIEIYNVLTEQKVAQNSSIPVKQVRSHIISTGNHRLLARLLWPLVLMGEWTDLQAERAIQHDSQVLVLSQSVGSRSDKVWKWGGKDDIVRSCSRRPYLGKVDNGERRWGAGHSPCFQRNETRVCSILLQCLCDSLEWTNKQLTSKITFSYILILQILLSMLPPCSPRLQRDVSVLSPRIGHLLGL